MMDRKILLVCISTVLLQACGNAGDNQQAAEMPAEIAPAKVFILSPADGATVTSPVTVAFGLDNFNLAPAGTLEADSGHHHLLIDTDLPALDQPIPADDNHLHFGKAQTETILELEPGTHTLQLLLGDGMHVPHQDALISERITITVTENPVTIQ